MTLRRTYCYYNGPLASPPCPRMARWGQERFLFSRRVYYRTKSVDCQYQTGALLSHILRTTRVGGCLPEMLNGNWIKYCQTLNCPPRPAAAMPKSKKPSASARLFSWGSRIRTSANGSRVRCPTARRTPNEAVDHNPLLIIA